MYIKKITAAIVVTLGALFPLGCRKHVETAAIPAVGIFDLARYCGEWYEIARLPQWFERDMTDVRATYTLQPNGTVKVENHGMRDGKPQTASAVGRFRGASDSGELEVSFFRPFYGGYRIIKLDPDYRCAVVTGDRFTELWILARSPRLDDGELDATLLWVQSQGFDLAPLEFTRHAVNAPACDNQ